jgi:hypothetical protein
VLKGRSVRINAELREASLIAGGHTLSTPRQALPSTQYVHDKSVN